MQAKDAIGATLNFSDMVLKAYISDLSDAELLQRPHPGCNHLAWQLGHLIASERDLLEMLQPGAGPELPACFADKQAKGNVGSDRPEDFCTRQEYLELTDKLHAATRQLLADYPEESLDLPSPEGIRHLSPTMGDLFLLVATHPMMHVGQFVPVRRALGKPVLI